MAEAVFRFQELFELGADDTPYRKLGAAHVSEGEFEGLPVLKIDGAALTQLASEAVRDVSHLFRTGHLAQLRAILDDPEASDNDRFVALELLKNANVSAGMVPYESVAAGSTTGRPSATSTLAWACKGDSMSTLARTWDTQTHRWVPLPARPAVRVWAFLQRWRTLGWESAGLHRPLAFLDGTLRNRRFPRLGNVAGRLQPGLKHQHVPEVIMPVLPSGKVLVP